MCRWAGRCHQAEWRFARKGNEPARVDRRQDRSGKSTLLHALIVNLALWYSPDEWSSISSTSRKASNSRLTPTLELPHAKVIAVESEREFGLSVLQRLDLELKRRGDLYREVGEQDVKGFRDARPDIPLPRILFIVDEFQEFFVEDDKISQEARCCSTASSARAVPSAFTSTLGSQTLGGAYSLARGTLGQMAIRIALQCSEADAHLILSEDNTAARLLTRPGEAIYNDANGMIEGNNLFQVVWLHDDSARSISETSWPSPDSKTGRPPRRSSSKATCQPSPARTRSSMRCLMPRRGPSRHGSSRPGWVTRSRSKIPHPLFSDPRAAATC